MIVFHNPVHALHNGRHEMFRGRLVPCVEVPSRLDMVLHELRARSFADLRHPGACDLALVRRVHAPPYIDFLARTWNDWVALDPANAAFDILPSVWPGHGLRRDVAPRTHSAQVGQYTFDVGTPITSGTWEAAVTGAACAIDAARAVADGADAAFALTRPPGHHAGADFYGGYCFLNNSALAAQQLRDAGANRVAVVDIDYHHGNGTQHIFYARDDVFTASIHGDPLTEYPFYLGYADETGCGAGAGTNLNVPLPIGTGFAQWEHALDQVLDAVARFGADALVVPLGVDTYEGDPISRFRLRATDFPRIGKRLAALRLPTVFVMEGGYAVERLGINVANVLDGFAQAR